MRPSTKKIPRLIVTEEELATWARETWVVYASDVALKKKLLVQVGAPRYRLFHGDELLLEGNTLANIVRRFNYITKPPIEEDKPKLDN